MDNNEISNSTVPVPFNQNIEKRRLEAFNVTFDKLVQYATDNGLKKPWKGSFASFILNKGLENFKPEDFFKDI
jgi:GH24 family phage-related lysozyme (muramidase)